MIFLTKESSQKMKNTYNNSHVKACLDISPVFYYGRFRQEDRQFLQRGNSQIYLFLLLVIQTESLFIIIFIHMFLCGNFCNFVSEQPQIIVSSIKQFKEYESNLSQLRSGISSNNTSSTIMMKKSKYKKFYNECHESNQYFIDEQFPPNQKSLGYSVKDRKIQWKKISKLIKDCVMSQGSIRTYNIQRCNSRDCYFIASISSLATDPTNIQNIFLDNFQINGYGIYKLIVRINGCPTELIIDDYIPVYAETNRPVFCNVYGKQIWPLLLQKAWAKIKGSYGQIQNGNPHEVFNTFSLSPNFYIDLNLNLQQENKQTIWNDLLDSTNTKSFICAGTNYNNKISALESMKTYPILSSLQLIANGARHRLIKLKNMGDLIDINNEKNRAYRKFLEQFHKKQLQMYNGFFNLNQEDQFIITYNELCTNFSFVDICYCKKNFSYEFHNVNLKNKQGNFIRIQVKQAHEAYLSISKIVDQKIKTQQGNAQNTKFDYGLTRIVVGKEIQNQRYQYYASKLQSNFQDLTLKVQFKEGYYIIMIQSIHQGQLDFKSIFSYYFATLQQKENKNIKILGEWPTSKKVKYLQKIFTNHAERLNDNLQKLSPKNDWIKSNLLYEQGGYGYIACHLDSKTKVRLQIFLDRNLIIQNGFDLQYLRQDSREIKEGQSQIFVLSCNSNCKTIQELQFPPPGFSISKIV